MGAPTSIREDISAEELRRLARQESDGRVACRLLALANALDGMSRERAAAQAGMDRQTLRDWVIRFTAEGIEGLRDRPRSGRPPWLDEGQLAAFKALVLRGPRGWLPRAASGGRPGAPRRARRRQQLAGQGSLPRAWLPGPTPVVGPERRGRGALRRCLHRERHAAAASRPRPVLAEGPPSASRGRSQGAGALQKKFQALIAEVARDHPEAERLEVWFQDEARVGQTGRLCRRWFQKGMRPRGRRDLRHQAVYLFGAVCPERDAGVALVLPSVSAAAMQAMLDELSTGGRARRPRRRADGPRRLAHRQDAGGARQPHTAVPAALLTGAERDRAGLAIPARAFPLAPPVAELRRHPRRLLRGLECATRRNRPHPLPLLLDWAAPVRT